MIRYINARNEFRILIYEHNLVVEVKQTSEYLVGKKVVTCGSRITLVEKLGDLKKQSILPKYTLEKLLETGLNEMGAFCKLWARMT